ncbi:Isochorismatase hydrolase [Exidia glandulosa HHB12029]|uniref:Isochorismatase hydrolase n=1 Tax=Exidia glandulosa HHB12029 TaxID=1314781 RepID=A0A165K186_EXIGL|nr:Isochorismatase hydrolase [Exidia glandulosa HHB12029]
MAGRTRPKVDKTARWGGRADFWVEYPNGLVDVSETMLESPLPAAAPPKPQGLVDIPVEGDRVVRVDPKRTALVVIDMQNFFLHPDMRDHPTGLACVDPIIKTLPVLRQHGVHIIWLCTTPLHIAFHPFCSNWGISSAELETLPPSLKRGFSRTPNGGFGSELPNHLGKLLMRGEWNADLYEPLQAEYATGKRLGTDVWIHKNRISGLWGTGGPCEVYLKENGIRTLIFAGVNADQCVQGTLVDASFKGYNIIVLRDGIATSSPEGGLENVIYNAGSSGFITDSAKIVTTASQQ